MKTKTWEAFQIENAEACNPLANGGDRLRSHTAYRKRFGKRNQIVVYDDNDHEGKPCFHFVCSFGPNDDQSHSGCFFRCGLTSIQQAMAEIDKRNYNLR